MNPSFVTEETPPDRPKSVRTRSVSELFDGVIVLCPCLNILVFCCYMGFSLSEVWVYSLLFFASF